MNEGLGESNRNDRGSVPEGAPRISEDRLYRALASTRRRRLLYLLLEEGKCTVEALSTILIGWDATETSAMATRDDRDRIAVMLEHVHLPLLADEGLIAYDRRSETVEIEPIDPVVEDLVRRSVEAEPRSTS